MQHNPITTLDLDEIAGRAAGLYEYATGLDAAWQAEADQLAGTDVPALLAEVRRLRDALAREERLHGDTIDDRDRFHDAADKLAYAVAPEEVIGEHSSMNCPWENALDLVTPKAEVDKLRAELAEYEVLNPQQCPAGKHADWLVDSEYTHACPWCRIAALEGPAVEARAALAALCYDLEDPGTAALGALYLLQRATAGVEAPRDDAALALARHDAQVIRKAAETLEATERDDDAVNLLYLLADATERASASASAVAVSGGEQQ